MKVLATGDKKEIGFKDPTAMSDAFGAFRAMQGIEENLTLIHSPVGCSFFTLYNQLLSVSHFERVATTALAERDVVFGGEEKLKRAIYKALEVFEPSVICVLESVTSRLIGEDVAGIVNRVSQELRSKGISIPMITVKAAYLEGDHTTGYNKIQEALVEALMNPPRIKRPKSINLLGFWPDMPSSSADVEELKRLLSELSLEINTVFLCETKLEDIRRAPEASLNVVLSEHLGISAAKLMEEKFGIPFIRVDYPVGITNTSRLLYQLGDFFAIGANKVKELIERESQYIYKRLRRAIYYMEEIPYLEAIISADSTYCIAFSRFLLEEWKIRPVVISMTTCEPQSLEALKKVEDDHSFEAHVLLKPSFHQLREALKEYQPQIVFGGSWELLSCEQLGLLLKGTSFIPISVHQQFGRLFIFPFPFVGFRGVLYLGDQIINERLKNWHLPQDYWQKYEYFKGY